LIPASYADLIDPTKPKSFPFRPGMSANADIQTNTHANVISVPINAVTTRDRSDTAVFGKEVKKEKKAETPSEPAGPDVTNATEEWTVPSYANKITTS
jgi:HlyD family secretion protein